MYAVPKDKFMEVVASTTSSYTALVENVLKKEKRKRAKFISGGNRIKAEDILKEDKNDLEMPAIKSSMFNIQEDMYDSQDEETVRPRLLDVVKPVLASEMGDSNILNQINGFDKPMPVESG